MRLSVCGAAALAALAVSLSSGCASDQTPNLKVDNVPEGMWTHYYQFGQKMERGEYVGGKRSGVWRRWYQDGQLQWISEYADGIRHGRFVSHNRDGSLLEAGRFVHGQRDGEWLRYFPANKGARRDVYELDELVTSESLGAAPPLPPDATPE